MTALTCRNSVSVGSLPIFPPLLCKDMRVLEAESSVSEGCYTENGILAGDPVAPQILKSQSHPAEVP